jgi:hypothetical protein
VFWLPLQHYDIEVSPYQDHEEEVEEKRAPSQEDESVRPHDLEIIHPTSQTKPKNFLEAIFTKCLTLPNNLENHINL